jgi:hypothetical protein
VKERERGRKREKERGREREEIGRELSKNKFSAKFLITMLDIVLKWRRKI